MIPCLCFHHDRLWIRRTPAAIEPCFSIDPQRIPLIERLNERLWVAETKDPPAADAERITLRALFDLAAPDVSQQAGVARQLLYWRQTHRFCGQCGTAMTRHTTERALCCPACAHTCYPRINPVAITLIHNGNHILLARKADNLYPFWSLIAGFVEAGESLEQTVVRETAEEVGIRVTAIRYAASQPWSYPNNLMIGFTAAYAGGEIRPDGGEIAEAGWFDRDHLPPIPTRVSLARHLIDAFFSRTD